MDIDKILEKFSIRCEKSKPYLKGLFNKEKTDLTDQFGDALTDDRRTMLAFIRVGKKYDITKDMIDGFIKDNTEKTVKVLDDDNKLDHMETIDEVLDDMLDGTMTGDKLDDSMTEDEVELTLDDVVDKGDDWKDYFGNIPDPVSVNTDDYEKKPSLNIGIGPTYYLKLTNPKKKPHTHEFDGSYGPYNKHAFDVQLIKVSDADLYDELYDYGDFKGQKAFVDGQKYTMWLDDKAAGFFKAFWKKYTEDGMPDDREFTFKKTQPGKYNIWTFKNIKR